MNNKICIYVVLAAAIVVVGLTDAFYLPGLAPKAYCTKAKATETCKSNLDVFVNRLDSVESVLPYEYTA